jgi:alpha-tubulin suppressor-like RCC1 family protein
MPGKFIGLGGVDLELAYVNDYAVIDEFARTGSLWLWGVNNYGQLGNNGTALRSSPVQTISAGTNWKQVDCGIHSIACVKTDGTLWLWGRGSYGRLGNNATTNRSSPVQTISTGTNWQQVSSGSNHTASVKTDGTLWLWGEANSGQLGNNATTSRSSPVQTISAGNNWKQVSCGILSTAAVKTDGTLWLWGRGAVGVLGTNDTLSRSSPVQTVSATTNWKQVSISNFNTAAVKTDGTLWLWGINNYGQLGNNSVGTSVSSPIQTIAGGTNWKQVSVGNSNCAAVKTDGTLWLWGFNNYGQLGNNGTAARSSPVQTVSGGTNWKQVSSRNTTTAAIKTDGTLWLWGRNYGGQLGDNTSAPTVGSRSSPVQTIAGGTNWKQVSLATNGSNSTATYFYDAGNLYPNS